MKLPLSRGVLVTTLSVVMSINVALAASQPEATDSVQTPDPAPQNSPYTDQAIPVTPQSPPRAVQKRNAAHPHTAVQSTPKEMLAHPPQNVRPTGQGTPVVPLTPQQAARIFAGLDAKGGNATHAHFQALASDGWTKYEKRVGAPLQAWAKKEIAYAGGGVVFYPFSGPDFLTVARVFPNADRYVLVAIQNARRPAQPESMPAPHRQAFEHKLGSAWERFGALGYFRTDDLNDDQRDRTGGIGVATTLMAFSARLGYDVIAVTPIAFNPDRKEWEPTTTDDWRSVRLSLVKEGRKSTLDYMRIDLSDRSLTSSEPQLAWIRSMATHPTLLKAASHLLQESYFTVLRDALVAGAPMVVQDETGLDYKDLSRIGPVTLYGNFVQTHKLFKTTTQRALAAAYKAEKKRSELPFAFSYLKGENARSMQIVRRQR